MLKRSFVRVSAILLFSSIIFSQQLNAQAPSNIFSNITVSSPNAASLGKYGDYPVSYNTGLPQISIPFYTIKEGPLSLPISISYHASGLKVMESSSWIGAGWALNAGGAITRTVVGAPDDRGHLTSTIKGHFSDYGYNSYNFDIPGGGGQGCATYPEINTALVNDADFVSGKRDGEPDLFFFNFGGYSGKFYFRDDRTPVLVPEADFKIEPITINTAENIIGFIITASDGTKYYFGKNQNADGNIDAVETTYPYTAENGLTSGDIYSAWYLNKIVSADGLFSITLIYQSEQYSDYTVSLFPVADGDIDNKHCTLVKNYLDGVRLKQVNFSNGTVKFGAGSVRTDLGQYTQKTISDIVNTDSKSLDTVTVTDNQNFCKNFILYHSYFVDNTTTLPYALTAGLSITTDTKRLRLDSIQEKTCDNSLSVPPYKFIYTVPSDSFAPRRLSFGQDHWGYYNGKYFNAGLIPTYTLNTYTSFAGADRESKWPEMSYGSLNKIIYPTGGYTQFTFEPNDVWLTYPYTVDSLVGSASIGPFFGTMTDQPISLTTSANTYKFILNFYQNSPGASIGTASITGQTVYANKSAPRGELIFVPGAGAKTYQFHQVDMLGTTGDYAYAKLYEMVPKTFTGNKIIGGLRIKSVTNNNGTVNDSATNYNYSSGSQSTGVLYSRPVYVRILRNEILRQVGLATMPFPSGNGCLTGNYDGTLGLGYKKSPSSLRTMETVQGNHIGYNTVEVSKSNNGKSQYKYYGSDIWDQNQTDVCTRNVNNTSCNITFPNWPDAPLPFEFMRGQLKYEAYYNQANNLLKDIFYYPLFVNGIVTTPASIIKNGAITFYNLTTAKKTKMTVVANEYPLTGGTITNIDSVFYESPYHQQQTRKVSINSKGVKTESKTKYAFDFRVPNCEAISDCWQAYATAYSNALNSYNLATNTCSNSGSCNCKWSVFQSYRYNWSVARKNYVSCRRSNFMDATNAFKTAHDNARTGADTELRPILILQDKFINAPIETTTWKNGNLIAASYIKYDSTIAPEPFGNANPSKQQEIKLAAPSATFTQAVSNNTTITKDTRYKDEATIKFAGGNVSEVQKKDGITYSYIWDYTKNFATALATAGASAEIAYTSFESNGTGSFTYTTYKTADITAPTGNYCYPIASGSIQKTNLISTKSYILSYWWKTGTSLGVTAGTQSNSITGYTRNGWTYRQLQFTGTVSAIISGTGFIDEVRIYPVGSQINTYTYSPLMGLTSQTDPNGKTSYYDYDKLGRLKNIKDQLKNITKNFFYNYGLNPTTQPALVNLNASNAAIISCNINLTSKTTGQVFNFSKTPGSTTIIGNVPPDVYDINVSLGSLQRYIQICSYGSYTSNFTAYNVQVDGLTCNTITIY